jgi:hypothetical protein
MTTGVGTGASRAGAQAHALSEFVGGRTISIAIAFRLMKEMSRCEWAKESNVQNLRIVGSERPGVFRELGLKSSCLTRDGCPICGSAVVTKWQLARLERTLSDP